MEEEGCRTPRKSCVSPGLSHRGYQADGSRRGAKSRAAGTHPEACEDLMKECPREKDPYDDAVSVFHMMPRCTRSLTAYVLLFPSCTAPKHDLATTNANVSACLSLYVFCRCARICCYSLLKYHVHFCVSAFLSLPSLCPSMPILPFSVSPSLEVSLSSHLSLRPFNWIHPSLSLPLSLPASLSLSLSPCLSLFLRLYATLTCCIHRSTWIARSCLAPSLLGFARVSSNDNTTTSNTAACDAAPVGTLSRRGS